MPTEKPTTAPSPRRVLLVDSAVVAEMYAKALRARGHDVDVRYRLTDALEVASGDERYDVAVLDVDLDIPSAGIDLGRRLRSRKQVARLVFLTGTDDPYKAVMALRLGTYVPKGTPDTFEELFAAVEADLEPQP